MRVIIFAVIVLFVSLMVALHTLEQNSATRVAIDPVPVTVVEARNASDIETIAATGTLVLKRETTLSFKVAGVINALSVRAGDAVKADQVLASLDQTEVAAREREAQAQVELTRKEFDRSSELYRRGIVAARRVEDAKAAFERARAGFDVVHFDRRWAELRAPWDGVVLSRSADAGEIVAPGRAVLMIGDSTTGFNLMAPIADRDVAQLAVGDRARISFAATDTPVAGHITRLTSKADTRTGSFEAEIALDETPASLRSGMIGDATITPSQARTSTLLAIPAEAIVEGDGERATIYVLKPDGLSAQLRQIQLTRLEGAQVLVRTGLALHEQVVVSGAANIRAGDLLRVVPAQSAALPNAPQP